MALITKQILECNKCGHREENAEANLNIFGEDFYLCDDCLENVVNWISKPINHTSRTRTDEPKHKLVPKHKPWSRWDEHRIDVLYNYLSTGWTIEYIAERMGTTKSSVFNMISRIRNSTPGDNLYPHKQKFEEVYHGRSKSGN